MFSARITEFLRFHPVGMLFFVLGRRVVPVLAIIALQRDNFAHQSGPLKLLDDLGDGAGAHGVAAFADGEAQTALERHRLDQRYLRRNVVSRHDHLHTRPQSLPCRAVFARSPPCRVRRSTKYLRWGWQTAYPHPAAAKARFCRPPPSIPKSSSPTSLRHSAVPVPIRESPATRPPETDRSSATRALPIPPPPPIPHLPPHRRCPTPHPFPPPP